MHTAPVILLKCVFAYGLLASVPAVGQINSFELHSKIPRVTSNDTLYQEALAFMRDTTDLVPINFVQEVPEMFALFGYGQAQLNYATGSDADALIGSATLTYEVKIVAKDKGFRIDITELKINGRAPFSEMCWNPCNTEPYPIKYNERNERVREEAKWVQLAHGARGHVNNLPGFLIMHKVRPFRSALSH